MNFPSHYSLEWIKGKLREWVGNVVDFCKRILGIHSPSKVFENVIGKNMALGIGEGFSDEMKNVTAEMQDAIPTDFDTTVNGSYNGLNTSSNIDYKDNYNSLVESFKQALSEMKIELDDENMGKFIDKTVARTIYS